MNIENRYYKKVKYKANYTLYLTCINNNYSNNQLYESELNCHLSYHRQSNRDVL